ncbi:MAG: hypothetical protein GY703_02410 [Gammaproteobacteria bacterium]|nr:hypothetical protein [Gammaproteobacteria bacterium]
MKIRIWKMAPRLTLGVLGACLIVSPLAAVGGTYTVLVNGVSNAGVTIDSLASSGFTNFTNPGTAGNYPISTPANSLNVDLTGVPFPTGPNSSMPIEVRFEAAPGDMDVVVAWVNYNDGKTPPNQITGNYVEGLSGTMTSVGTAGSRYTINFLPPNTPAEPSASNPDDFVRLCELRDGGQVVSTSCSYHVQNNAIGAIPEPAPFALISVALAAAAMAGRRRQRGKARLNR